MQRILMATTLALNSTTGRLKDPSSSDSGVSFYTLNSAIWTNPDCVNQEGLSKIVCSFDQFGYVRFLTPGAIISAAFPYLFGIAGLILFVMLVIGALEIMMGAGNPKSAESGQKRITTAVIGFLLLFAAFWIAQIISIIFGLNIGLGGATTP